MQNIQGYSSGLSGDILSFTKHNKTQAELQKELLELKETDKHLAYLLNSKRLFYDDGTVMPLEVFEERRMQLIALKAKKRQEITDIKQQLAVFISNQKIKRKEKEKEKEERHEKIEELLEKKRDIDITYFINEIRAIRQDQKKITDKVGNLLNDMQVYLLNKESA